MIEYTLTLTELRKYIGEIVMAATYGDARYVVTRFGKEIGFVGGLPDLQLARDRDERALKRMARDIANPPPPPDPLDQLRQMHARGEPIPTARTPEERELEFKLAMEIGERLMREAEMKAKA
jgi:hypothetical protein